MVVFDELPGHALMDAEGRIDAERFPNFAALAGEATWYRNATTSRSDTELAVPTLATGINAPLDSLATTADHPRSLFTLLGSSYEMHVSEPWTNLCPDELCDGTTESLEEGGLASSWRRSRRSSATCRCPTRSGSASRARAKAARSPGQVSSRPSPRRSSRQDGPVLHFLHVLLPHKAWRYLPRARCTPTRSAPTPSWAGSRIGQTTSGRCSRREQRFLLQLQYTDELLGGLYRQAARRGHL